jgi:hypothetical protein
MIDAILATEDASLTEVRKRIWYGPTRKHSGRAICDVGANVNNRGIDVGQH